MAVRHNRAHHLSNIFKTEHVGYDQHKLVYDLHLQAHVPLSLYIYSLYSNECWDQHQTFFWCEIIYFLLVANEKSQLDWILPFLWAIFIRN